MSIVARIFAEPEPELAYDGCGYTGGEKTRTSGGYTVDDYDDNDHM